MFDTIVYIPTILAYAFISLLIVILCFIVIYVSHKVFLNVYDILPVPSPEESKMSFKSKPPALRIVIYFGRSHLAVVVLHPMLYPKMQLLKYVDSIAAIPWNDTSTDDENWRDGGGSNDHHNMSGPVINDNC